MSKDFVIFSRNTRLLVISCSLSLSLDDNVWVTHEWLCLSLEDSLTSVCTRLSVSRSCVARRMRDVGLLLVQNYMTTCDFVDKFGTIRFLSRTHEVFFPISCDVSENLFRMCNMYCWEFPWVPWRLFFPWLLLMSTWETHDSARKIPRFLIFCQK